MPYIAYAFCGPLPVKVIAEEPKHEWLGGTRWTCKVTGKGPGFEVGEILYGIAGDMIYDTASSVGARTNYGGRSWMEKFQIKEYH